MAGEHAAGLRAAEDFVPTTGMSAKDIRQRKAALKEGGGGACARWIVPSDPLESWFFRLAPAAALWEGVIMPRRA